MPTESEYESEYKTNWETLSSSYNDLATLKNTITNASISSCCSISPYIAVSSLSPADTWTISFDPKETKTTIKAEASYIPPFGEYNAEIIEKYLREQVAAQLASQLLIEDLIKIQGSTERQVDGSTVYKMKAEVKIIQE